MSADEWWKYGVIYQIYPRSFQDSNGDGIGDLPGIRQRLDYLVALGVDAVWISPFYPSPMADFGYDISDYCDVDPRFGTLADFDALALEAKARGIKLILDFVPNHSSDRHPWFLQSRRSRDDPMRDWYIWADPAPDGGPPNNWLSNFGGPAWTFDATTGQYYAHAFLKEQPDLNWRNPEVRAAMYEAMRFWLRRGVDGFRVDVIYHLLKDAQLRDNPVNPAFVPGSDPAHRLIPLYTTDQPEVQDIVVQMRAVLDEFSSPTSSRVLIGEVYLPIDRLMRYYGLDSAGVLRGAQLPFNFHLIGAQWQAAVIDRLVREYEAALPPGAAPNWVLGNHDKPRIATRVGEESARVAAMLLLTLRGTPTLYYGDEIGMADVTIPADEVQDPFERNAPGHGLGRDPERTPMPWSGDAPNAGFTRGKPWLRLARDWRHHNVGQQLREPQTLLQLYRRMLALRRSHAALNRGSYVPIAVHGNVLAYAREANDDGAKSQPGERIVVLLNFGHKAVTVNVDSLFPGRPGAPTILLSTLLDREETLEGKLRIRGDEGLVVGLV